MNNDADSFVVLVVELVLSMRIFDQVTAFRFSGKQGLADALAAFELSAMLPTTCVHSVSCHRLANHRLDAVFVTKGTLEARDPLGFLYSRCNDIPSAALQDAMRVPSCFKALLPQRARGESSRGEWMLTQATQIGRKLRDVSGNS